MGVYEGRGQLGKGIKDLMQQWADTKQSWDDALSKQFEERHLLPMAMDLRNAVSAMDHIAALLQQIRKECE